MKYITFLLLLSLMVGCSGEKLPAGDRAGGVKFSNPTEREKILVEFRNEKIPFEIDERGFVNFMLRDQARVLGIIRTAKFGKKLNPNYFESLIVHSIEAKNKYITELNINSIPYRIDSYEGSTHIFWEQTYGPQVDQIQQKVNTELRRASRNKAVEQGQAPASLAEGLNN